MGYSQCTCSPSTWFVPNVLQGCIYTSELQRTIHWPHLLFTNVLILHVKMFEILIRTWMTDFKVQPAYERASFRILEGLIHVSDFLVKTM